MRFCRYADDYRLFANSRNEAFRALVLLSETLLGNEGLTLQRQKTRVLSSRDFLRSPSLLPEDSDELTPDERRERRFLNVSLRYDPYSPNAVEDYERLKESLQEFDILDMLTAEVEKSRVNLPVIRRLVGAISVMDLPIQEAAAATLIENLEVLAPALPVVLRVLDELMPTLGPASKARITATLRQRLHSGDYLLTIPVNLGYALRVLRHDRSDETIALVTDIFESAPPFIQRDIVYVMHAWGADYWLSDKRRQWMNLHPWVRRAILLATFALGDEGRHWRRAIAPQLGAIHQIALDWMRTRVFQNQRELPL